MARPIVGKAKDQQLVVRLPSDLRLRVEAIRTKLSKRAKGIEQVTSHVVRELIERGCDYMERELERK